MLKGYPGKDNIMGRLDGTLPRDGELNPDLVGKALCFNTKEGAPVPEIVAPRPPALCTGCSHRDVYKALNEVIATYGEGRVFSDIGCYTSSFPVHQLLCRHGSFYHDGQRSL